MQRHLGGGGVRHQHLLRRVLASDAQHPQLAAQRALRRRLGMGAQQPEPDAGGNDYAGDPGGDAGGDALA